MNYKNDNSKEPVIFDHYTFVWIFQSLNPFIS